MIHSHLFTAMNVDCGEMSNNKSRSLSYLEELLLTFWKLCQVLQFKRMQVSCYNKRVEWWTQISILHLLQRAGQYLLCIRTNTCQPHTQGGTGVCCKTCYDRNHKLTEKYAHANECWLNRNVCVCVCAHAQTLLLLLGCMYTYEVCLWSSMTCCHLWFSRTNLFNALLIFPFMELQSLIHPAALTDWRFMWDFYCWILWYFQVRIEGWRQIT